MLADISTKTRIAEVQPWEIRCAPGPVLAAAVHAGHEIRPELAPYLALTSEQRLREEDPFTDFWMTLGDTTVRVNRSRFEVDLNRPLDLAVYLEPAQSWGLEVWRELPPQVELDRSRALHEQFYGAVSQILDGLVERWGAVLVLDLHSYNHRRPGPDAEPQDQASNPDLDLGVTTLDHGRFGSPATRSPNSRRAKTATTVAVAAWISGSGSRTQTGASEPIEVDSRRIQAISGGLE